MNCSSSPAVAHTLASPNYARRLQVLKRCSPVTFGDVLSLARRPTEALRLLVDPEDLIRITTRLRSRTTHLFEGLFEPGPKPPQATPTADGTEEKKPK